jgi:ATP synthase protein I
MHIMHGLGEFAKEARVSTYNKRLCKISGPANLGAACNADVITPMTTRRTPRPAPPEDNANEPAFKQLTRQQAQALREKQPQISPWRVIGWQIIAGGLIALGAWAASGGQTAVAISAGYGALIVIVPAAVLARGIMSPMSSLNAVSAALGFMVWEMVKIGLSVAMFFAAPQLIAGLSWPALLAGLVLTMKVYWLAAVFSPKPKK